MNDSKLKAALKAYQLKSVHPAADLFPMLPDDEYQALVDDVRENGFQSPGICDPDGRLIDGRNRICASMDANIDLPFKEMTFKDESHVLTWIVSQNVRRRHLTQSQRNCLGAQLLPMFEAVAKQRQKEALARGNKTKHGEPSIRADLPESRDGKDPRARDDAAKATGGSARGVQQAKRVQEVAPDLFEKASQGEISLDAAEKVVKKRVREEEQKVKSHDPQPTPSKDNLVIVITEGGKTKRIKAPKTVRFNKTNDSVDWARWTWNPVTGCNHGCEFCYAREIAHSDRMADYYPFKFAPSFHEYRLDAPKNTTLPESDDDRDGRVFVCSMADLFGKWVPNEWIRKVFDACLESPEWTYLFLTKWPARYSQMPLLENAWYGASVVTQGDVRRVSNAMKKIDAPNIVRWVSMEPMLSQIQFDDLSWCDLMVIGSQTSTNQPTGRVEAVPTPFDWIVDVVNQCRECGVPYYLKANLGMEQPGMVLPKERPRCIALTKNT